MSLNRFNPSNDMALAADTASYSPPRPVAAMERDLAALADLWDDGRGDTTPRPWGWSRATRTWYKSHGTDPAALPTDTELATWRTLSGRAFAADYIRAWLQGTDPDTWVGHEMQFCTHVPTEWPPAPPVLSGVSSVLSSVLSVPSSVPSAMPHTPPESGVPRWIFKAPWSSSGRGIVIATDWNSHVRGRLEGFVRRQGGFLADRYYDKTLDFALEFLARDDGRVRCIGYSVFEAGASGRYAANLIAPQRRLRHIVETAAGRSLAACVRRHEALLTARLGGRYAGPLGIDMLVAREGGRTVVHPCVEINLRMNMGILALLLERRKWDVAFYQRLRRRLEAEDFPFARFGDLDSCMRSSTRVPLTPSREHGFQAVIEAGRLVIVQS